MTRARAAEEAQSIVRKLCKAVHRAKNRKVQPEGDAPAELRDIVLDPDWACTQQRAGVWAATGVRLGSTAEALALGDACWAQPNVHRALRTTSAHSTIGLAKDVLRAIVEGAKVDGALPAACNNNKGFDICKQNQKPGVQGRRALHSMPALSKAWLRSMWRPPTPGSSSFGCIPGRSREEAVAARLVLGARTRLGGMPTAQVLFDVRNAFPSIERERAHHEHVSRDGAARGSADVGWAPPPRTERLPHA